MATKTKLNMKFVDAASEEMTVTLSNYVDEDVEDSDIKALCSGIVTNKAIFRRPPQSVKSAEIVTTVTTPIDLSD